MIAVDTSVVIAGFASWHESHELAREALAERPALPAPAALETYAVLTRLAPPHRADHRVVDAFLSRTFPAGPLILPAAPLRRVVTDLAELGIVGGASYDAVIAMTAAHHDCELVTLDARARTTYERVGVTLRFLD